MEGMLAGVRILDSTTAVAMPTGLAIMSDMGAEIIKVETASREGAEARGDTFQLYQRNRMGITINVKAPGGMELFKELVKVCDVVMENNRAGTFVRQGLGYDDLKKINPQIIMLSNTGFGNTGPWKRYTGHGTFIEHDAGMGYFSGYRDQGPRQIGNAWIDLHAGWLSVFAVITALYHRAETGEGQYIDFSMYESGTTTMGPELLDFISNGDVGKRMGNRHPYYAPQGVWACKGDDKWIGFGIESDAQWQALCEVMGDANLAKNPKFSDALSRLHNQDDLEPIIGAWAKNQDDKEAMKRLQAKGIPAFNMPDASEVMTDPHLKQRGFFQKMVHTPDSGVGTRLFPTRAWKASKTDPHFRSPAPYLGQHNEYVFGEIMGMSQADIEKLYETGVAAKVPPSPNKAPARAAREGGRSKGTKDSNVENQGVKRIDADYQKRLGVE